MLAVLLQTETSFLDRTVLGRCLCRLGLAYLMSVNRSSQTWGKL